MHYYHDVDDNVSLARSGCGDDGDGDGDDKDDDGDDLGGRQAWLKWPMELPVKTNLLMSCAIIVIITMMVMIIFMFFIMMKTW